MQDFSETGRLWLRGALGRDVLGQLDDAAELGGKAGARFVANEALSQLLGRDGPVGQAVGLVLPGAKPVRIVAFNKSTQQNWAVPWHQDRVIAVKGKHVVSGVSNWSRKGGIWHCEPPLSVLDSMLFVRIHLDDQTADNGAMEIATGSHKLGAVPTSEAAGRANALPHEICEAIRGDNLILHMLTLHRSRPSISGAPRRVLRVDYSNDSPPSPLCWAV